MGQHTDNVWGWHGLLHHYKIPRRLIDEDWLNPRDSSALDGLKALILPYLSMLDENQMEAIAAFAQRGGLVWSDPWLGQRDRTGACRDTSPGGPLVELFGCTQGQVFPIVENTAENRGHLWRGAKMLKGTTCRVQWGEGRTAELPTCHHNIELHPRDGAEVIGRFENGLPALVRHTVGRGVCYYSGAYVADAMRKTAVAGGFEMAEKTVGSAKATGGTGIHAHSFFRNLFESRGIQAPIEPQFACPDDVIASLLVGDGEAVAVFVNYRPDTVEGSWRIRPDFTPTSEAKDLVNDRSVSLACSADGTTLSLCLPRYGIAAIHFHR